MIKTPLRYPGGKSKALKQIAPLMPAFEELREPFVGGGSVFIYAKQKFPDKKFWINDLYPELFSFWKIAQQDMSGLLEQIQTWKKSFSDGRVLHKFLLENISAFEGVKKAAAFFLLNRITFSGTSESGGYSNQAFLKRLTDSSIERVAKLESLLQGVQITNSDYREVVEKEGEKVFLFLDPPYHSATKSALYGKNGNLHKTFDHQRFALIMKNCPHPWLITYDDSPYIRELFSFAKIFSWNLTYGMRNVTQKSSQKASEIFVSNYLEKLPAAPRPF